MTDVRRLAPDDAPAYRALMLDAYLHHPDAFTSSHAERAAQPADWWAWRLAPCDGAQQRVFGAFVGRALVGAAGWSLGEREKARHRAELFGMAVAPGARGAGAGRALMDAILADARAAGAHTITLTVSEGNRAAERLYARCGFVRTGVEPMAVRGDGRWVAKVSMWRSLAATSQAVVETIASRRAHVAVEHMGDGPPVVFLHAAVADRRTWRDALVACAPGRHAIAFDRRGFGDTPAVADDCGPVDDLLAVLDRFVPAGARAVLVGCSQGGGIAIDAALAAPERIGGLVLMAPSVGGAPAPTPHDAVRARMDAIAQAEASGDVERTIAAKAALWLDGPLSDIGRVNGEARALFTEMNRGIARPSPPIALSEHSWSRLGEIDVPAHVFCGDLDLPHIRARCVELAERLRDARLEVLHGVAHLAILEEPASTTVRLMRALDGLRGA